MPPGNTERWRERITPARIQRILPSRPSQGTSSDFNSAGASRSADDSAHRWVAVQLKKYAPHVVVVAVPALLFQVWVRFGAP